MKTVALVIALAWLRPLVLASGSWSTSGAHSALSVHEAAAQQSAEMRAGKRMVLYSEYKLRATVQTVNYDLRQLKRDFMNQMTDIYLALKLDSEIGWRKADESNSEIASANILLAAEFCHLAIKKFTIERRLLTGLKSAFVRFMPMDTLVRLYKRYDTFAWLRYQSQCELRAILPAATKDELVEALYAFVEARARVRAANDVLALSADNMQRILQVFQWNLVESAHSEMVRGSELEALANQARRLLEFYNGQVVDWAAKLRKEYKHARRLVRPLYEALGGRRNFLALVDEIINAEVLDIDLSADSAALNLPPTVNKQLVYNAALKWIPTFVLKSLEEDRKLLMDKRKLIMHLVRLDPEKRKADLGQWSAYVLSHVCRNKVVYY